MQCTGCVFSAVYKLNPVRLYVCMYVCVYIIYYIYNIYICMYILYIYIYRLKFVIELPGEEAGVKDYFVIKEL